MLFWGDCQPNNNKEGSYILPHVPATRTRVAAVVLLGESLLVIERFANGERYFVLPGGGLEDGENPTSAAAREVAEETSLQVKVVRELASYETPEQSQRHQIFLCEIVGGDPTALRFAEGTNEMSSASAENTFEPRWIPIADVPQVALYPRGTREVVLGALRG